MFIFRNPNPLNNLVGDCVIRGISILTDKSWESTYMNIVEQGGIMYDMEGSYRRGRDAMGRYTSREGGYSGHEEEREQMMRQIEDMKLKVQQM